MMIGTIGNLAGTFDHQPKIYSQVVKQVLQYLEEHYCEPISLTEVAGHLHFHPNYLSQIFKAETGENFSEYLRRLRLIRAQYMLKHTDLKATQIAERIGYPNLNYFCRIFKRYTGKKPLEYRNGLTE